jgi:putative effector of murein hydrolase LrgA (UPF0299 family)
MTIDVHVISVVVFLLKTAAWGVLSILLWFFMYFSDDVQQFQNTPIKNTIFGLLVVAMFLLIYGIVEINWLP